MLNYFLLDPSALNWKILALIREKIGKELDFSVFLICFSFERFLFHRFFNISERSKTGMCRVSSWLEFTRVSNSNFDSNSTLFWVYLELVTRTHSYPADFQKTRWLTQLDDFDSSSTRVCQKLRSRRDLKNLLIYLTTEIHRFELSLTDFPVSRTYVRFLKQKLKKIGPNFFKINWKTRVKLEFWLELHSNSPDFQQTLRTRDSNSLKTYTISKDFWLELTRNMTHFKRLVTFDLTWQTSQKLTRHISDRKVGNTHWHPLQIQPSRYRKMP